jgi:uncharacterized Fe-S cluster-containing radical SAM superfamily protein
MSASIKTAEFSVAMRERGIDVDAEKLRITNFSGSGQEKDFTEPSNCRGFGRVRHFRRQTSEGWPENSLPIDPAASALGMDLQAETLNAQVFQTAVCNWRCWYCFVDFDLLSGSSEHSKMLTPAELVAMYAEEDERPLIIDLSGGQPDLVPEWAPWMIRALEERGLGETVYLWSDDNLSTDYFWRYLTAKDRAVLDRSPMYGKVCCFKGFDDHSFAFNTAAEPELFTQQLALMDRLLSETKIDLYAYATFTSDTSEGLGAALPDFVDRLQELDVNLPLRTIPLEIATFSPVVSRMNEDRERALSIQQEAIAMWNDEMRRRFSDSERRAPICEVRLRSGR